MDKNFLTTFYSQLTKLTAQAISEFRKDKIEYLDKAATIKQAIDINTDLSIEETAKVASAINELHTLIKKLIEATNASKTETVTVDNLGDVKTDLSPLERNFETLNDSMVSVRNAISAIPKSKELDMSGIEKLLGKIVNKKEKEIDVSELEVISSILSDVLLATQTTASFSSINPADKIVPELRTMQNILELLNKNVEDIDLPEFDYKKLAKIIKENVNISIASSGGSSEYLRNPNGIQIFPATENKQDTIIGNQNKYLKAGTASTLETRQGYAGHQFTIGYIEDVVRSYVPGASIFSSYGNISTAGATRQPVHPTGVLNLPPVAGVQMSFVSTSASDSSAGSGIRKLRMIYVEAVTYILKSEIITLSGLTPVTSAVSNIVFVNDLRLYDGGSGEWTVAAGDITMSGAGTGTFYGKIFAGTAEQKSSFRMVPATATSQQRFVVKQTFVGSVSATADTYSIFELVIKTGNYFTLTNGFPIQDASQNIDLLAGTALPTGTIFGGVHTTNKAAIVTCSFIGILENV